MSTKFDFDTPVNRRGTHCVKWDECHNEKELPLWVADMDFRTAPVIIEALERRVHHGIFGYSFPTDEYYDAVREWFKRRHSWDIPKEQVIYTTGVVPATSAVIKALARPGDGVVILTPVYTCFFSSIRNNGCAIIESPLKMEDGLYRIDFEDLDKKLALPAARLLLLCNPHNPGGRVWTADELRRVSELCDRHGITVLSDEIHCEITRRENPYTPWALVAVTKRPYVSMISPSKSFNTAGLHIANIVCPDPETRDRINRAININETCDVGPFGIEALIAAYTGGEPWLNEMIDYVYANFDFLCKRLENLEDIKVMKLEGSYLAWINVEKLKMPSATICDRLRHEADVWFHPGTSYGSDGEGYIRINMATARSILAEALDRFTRWLEANFN